jgi:hypothetical protein
MRRAPSPRRPQGRGAVLDLGPGSATRGGYEAMGAKTEAKLCAVLMWMRDGGRTDT